MIIKGFILTIAVLLTSCISSPQESIRDPSAASLISQMEIKIADKLFDEAFNQLLGRSPEWQTKLGIHDSDHLWNDISDSYADETLSLHNRLWQNIRRSVDYDQLDRQTKLSYRLFAHNTRIANERHDLREYTHPISPGNGLHTHIPAFLINTHPSASKADMKNYITRLKGVRPLLTQLIANLRQREAAGLVPPRFVFMQVIEDCRNIIRGRPFDQDPDYSVLLEDFASKLQRLELGNAERSLLFDQSERALSNYLGPAYEGLISYLQELESRATSDLSTSAWGVPPDREQFYATILRHQTTTDLTPEELHELGLSEVARIHVEMHQVMDELGFEGDLTSFFESVVGKTEFYFSDTAQGRQDYLTLAVSIVADMQAQLASLFMQMPEADLIVKAIEPFREKSAGRAFYSGPAPDGSRPGIFFVNLSDPLIMPAYELEALVYHHAIPGHHLQHSIAMNQLDLPQFRRHGDFNAYTEGWASYMEYIAREIGFYADPYSNFGRLAMDLSRAGGLVVDTGIHHKKWTREQAIRYLDENTPASHRSNTRAVNHYIVTPGRAAAAQVGMIELLNFRHKAETRLGENFDLREFHNLVLESAPVPLTTLGELVDNWIAERLARLSDANP